MKKISLIFLLMSATVTVLSAKDSYIKVMSVWHGSDLSKVQYDLKKIGYKMYSTKYKGWDRIYSGPFKNKNEANAALIEIRKCISKGAYLSSAPLSDETIVYNEVQPMHTKQVTISNSNEAIDKVAVSEQTQAVKAQSLNDEVTKEKNHTTQLEDSNTISTKSKEKIAEPLIDKSADTSIISKSKNDNHFFIGLTGGASYLTIDKNTVNYGVPLNFKLRDSGLNYGAEAGYNFNNNIFMTLNYQYTNLDNIYFNNVFTTLNYKFDEIYSIYPYMGILAGYSMMDWKNKPTNSVTTTDTTNDTSVSFLGGVQVGGDIPINGDISVYLFYRYFMMNYVDYIKTTTTQTELKYSGEQNLNIGIKYNF